MKMWIWRSVLSMRQKQYGLKVWRIEMKVLFVILIISVSGCTTLEQRSIANCKENQPESMHHWCEANEKQKREIVRNPSYMTF